MKDNIIRPSFRAAALLPPDELGSYPEIAAAESVSRPGPHRSRFVTIRHPVDHWLTLGELDGRPTIQMHTRSQSPGLPVGVPAPDITIQGTPGHWLTLSEFHGRPVILAFLANDGSVGSDLLTDTLEEMLPQFQHFDAALFGICVKPDRPKAGEAAPRNLRFPLLADSAPSGAISRTYGVYRDTEGNCENALFIISPEGNIHRTWIVPAGAYPCMEELLAALRELCGPTAAAA